MDKRTQFSMLLKSQLLRVLLLTLVASGIVFSSSAQRIYIDTVTYAGTLKISKIDVRYKRIKSVTGSVENDFMVYDPEPNAIDETLLLFDQANNRIVDFKLNEVVADHDNAVITTTECLVSDSSLKLIRYTYWGGRCHSCDVGVERFTYGINKSNSLYLKDSSSIFSQNAKQKLRISKAETSTFRQVIMKSTFLSDLDKRKLYEYLY